MDIALVGTGAVAHSVGEALVQSGHRVVTVWGRNEEKARQLAHSIKADYVSGHTLSSLQAEVTLVCVSDRAIASVVAQLSAKAGVVAHTSGATPLLSCENIANGVLYPLYSFSLGQKVNWAQIPLLIEGDTPHTEEVLLTLGRSLSPHSTVSVSSADRVYYHMLGVWVNNFTNHILSQAESLAHHHQMDWALLQPIAQETLHKVFTMGGHAAQSGPAQRGDMVTLERHRQLLEANPQDEGLIAMYDFLSQSIAAVFNKEHKA